MPITSMRLSSGRLEQRRGMLSNMQKVKSVPVLGVSLDRPGLDLVYHEQNGVD